MDWKEEIKNIVTKGCSDSDIEDYIDEHPSLNGREIWDYIAELGAPEGCKGCKYVQLIGMGHCLSCTRQANLKDYFEAR